MPLCLVLGGKSISVLIFPPYIRYWYTFNLTDRVSSRSPGGPQGREAQALPAAQDGIARGGREEENEGNGAEAVSPVELVLQY